MAFTRITPNSPGVHLSSPTKDYAGHLSSPLPPGEAGHLLDIELTMEEDHCSQKLWLNPSLSPLLDTCLLGTLLEFPGNDDLSNFPDTLGTFIISVQDAADKQESSVLSLSPCSMGPEWTQHGSVVPGSTATLEKTAGIQQVL